MQTARGLGFLWQNARWLSVGGALMFLSSFGQTFFISLFAGHIRAEYGLSHGDWGAIYAAGTLMSAGAVVWAGTLSDRLRVRVLGPMVLAGLALACLMMAGNRAIWALVGVIFLLRFFGQGMASHVAQVAMARWFVAARGKALALASVGFAVGEALLPVIVVHAMRLVPWRGVWGLAALVALLSAIPIVLALKRERTPQSAAQGHDATGMGNRHWQRSQVLGDWLFWLLVPLLVAMPAFGTAFFFQQVHLCETKGWAHVEFVALIPFYTGTAVIAMMVSGWAIDRWGGWRMMAVFALPFAAGFALMDAASSLGALLVIFVLFGISSGINATLPGAFWAETYGTRHLGAIKSLASAIMVLGSAIGPGVSGWLIDAGVAFEDQASGVAVYVAAASAVAAVALARARRRR